MPRPSDANDGTSVRRLLGRFGSHVWRSRTGQKILVCDASRTKRGAAHHWRDDGNQDTYGQVSGREGRRVFFVGDAMGLHRDGSWFAGRLRYWFKRYMRLAEGAPEAALTWAIEQTHRKLYEESLRRAERSGYPAKERPGSTIAALLWDPHSEHLSIAWVGDSPVKRYRDRQLEILTHPHTLAQRAIDEAEAGCRELTSEEVKTVKGANRNQLWQAMGFSERIDPGKTTSDIKHGDVFTISSDGADKVPRGDPRTPEGLQQAIIEKHLGSSVRTIAGALLPKDPGDDATLEVLKFWGG